MPKGERYLLRKVSRFGPLRGTWEVGLDANGLKEKATFEKAGEDLSPVAYAYVFMHCWSPRMMNWLAILKNGTQVAERFPDEASKSLQKDISALAVYSETERTGALLTYAKVYPGLEGRLSFLNNFPGRHNKLYLTVTPSQLVAEAYSCEVRGFQAENNHWEQTVADMLAENKR
jgi:hypothetical protein